MIADFERVDEDFWRNSKGYIRKVQRPDRPPGLNTAYVCWNHFKPAIGYFQTFQDAEQAMRQQETEI